MKSPNEINNGSAADIVELHKARHVLALLDGLVQFVSSIVMLICMMANRDVSHEAPAGAQGYVGAHLSRIRLLRTGLPILQ